MNIKYKIYNGFKADTIADTSDDTISEVAPSTK